MTPVVAAMNAFGFDLYGVARRDAKNLGLSPFSVATALHMILLGARGDTASELRRALHAAASPDARELGALLSPPGPAQVDAGGLHVANRLFLERSYALEASYVDEADARFAAGVDLCDFVTSPEPSRERINAWVSDRTKAQIRSLIPGGGVTSATRLVLVNAVHFKAPWKHPFPPDGTIAGPFRCSPTDVREVPMMVTCATLPFAHTDGVTVLELPYAGGRWAMTLVVPDVHFGLAAVEAALTPERLAGWVRRSAPKSLMLAMPRFEIDAPGPLQLVPLLAELGVRDAFDRERADLGGIASPRSTAEPLVVSDIIHKAVVRVDEEGTVAAAATATRAPAIGMSGEAAEFFGVDHPFLFLVRDVKSSVILFMGRVAEPAAPCWTSR